MHKKSINPNLIIPVGTQVVIRIEVRDATTGDIICPKGAVGEVVQIPADGMHTYRVKFPNNFEASFNRHELAIRKHYQQGDIGEPNSVLKEFDLYECIIYQCVVGSRAYGLDHTESDTDRRGIYLPPADMHWSLYGLPEQLEDKDAEECYWEIQKFITLALKANPNVLECLYTPLIEKTTYLADELLSIRTIFLSKLIYQTYNGYVMSQFKKLEQDLRNRGGIRWKHAMHLVRLLLSGITILKEGFVPVNVNQYRDQLLAIRNGNMRWEEIDAWRLNLHKEFNEAFTQTHLPERPNYEKANEFLIKARREMV
jgi:uncharacterized protein